MVRIPEIIKRYKLILQNASYLSIIEIIRLAMPFVALPYIIRTIGADNYGIIIFAQTIISYFIVFINFGLDISAVKDVSINRQNREKLGGVVSSVLSIKLAFLIISSLALCIAAFFIPYIQNNRLLFFFCFFTCFSEVLFPIWFYQGIEKMKYLALIRFISIILYVSSIFIFIHSADDYIFVPLLQSGCNIIGGLVSLYVLINIERFRFRLPTKDLLIKTFLNSIPFFFSRLSVIFNANMAKLFCGFFFSMQAVAAFDIAQKIATVSLTPAQMLNQAIYPQIARTRDGLFAKKCIYGITSVSFAIMLFLIIISPYIISFFAQDKLPESVTLLRILSIWTFLGGITIYLGTSALVSFGYSAQFNKSVIYSSAVLLVCYLIMYIADIINIYNFALTIVITEFMILAYRYYFVHKFKLFSIKSNNHDHIS